MKSYLLLQDKTTPWISKGNKTKGADRTVNEIQETSVNLIYL